MKHIYNQQNKRHANWYLTNNIRMLRNQRGMTQADLARKVGVSRQAISCIECGKSDPQTSLGIVIAEALGVTTEQTFSVKPFPAAPWRQDPWVGTQQDKQRWRRMLSFTR